MGDSPLQGPRLFITLAYLGTRYHGWQTQKQGEVTIQGLIQEALEKLTGKRISVAASGRTDAGVHAEGQVAHLNLPAAFPPGKLQKALNALLPHDIRITSVRPVPPRAHARKDAISKTYRYEIFTGQVLSPFLYPIRTHVRAPLSRALVERSLTLLKGKHDFAAFATGAHLYASTVRTLIRADLRAGHESFSLSFTGNGFMRHMVRRLVGSILEVARGKEPPEWLEDLLHRAPPGAAGPTAPARGLILERVEYPPSCYTKEHGR